MKISHLRTVEYNLGADLFSRISSCTGPKCTIINSGQYLGKPPLHSRRLFGEADDRNGESECFHSQAMTIELLEISLVAGAGEYLGDPDIRCTMVIGATVARNRGKELSHQRRRPDPKQRVRDKA
uniref:Uncharacterized protein n=1 Tax=Coccidioides posadasii RMSCC 3488 TaxID=454284 RepID=A0A0J6F5F0_COCPO|nr:hypothetical protein CPAG_00882 [Coccidioides posadasii RMSCC 3488]